MATVAKSDRSTTITLASASAGPFDLDFRLFDTDALAVYVNHLPRTDWTLNATFVDGFDDSAAVTFDTPLADGDVVIVDSDLFPWREQDYLNSGNLVGKLNGEFGRVWSSLSDLRRDTHRSARFFQSVSPVALEAGRAVIVNASSDGVEMGPTADEISSAQGYATAAAASAAEAAEYVRTTFDTVADMVASDGLLIGDVVTTLGYNAAGDGGATIYEIVAAGTGTDDGGSYIDLSGISGQAEARLTTSIHAAQFGAQESTGAVTSRSRWNAMLAYIRTKVNLNGGDPFPYAPTYHIFGGMYAMGNSLNVNARSVKIHCDFIAGDGWVGGATDPVVIWSSSAGYADFHGQIDCAGRASGIHIIGGRADLSGANIYHFSTTAGSYGVKMGDDSDTGGGGGDSWLRAGHVTQWFPDDAEFSDEANWTGDAVVIDRPDVKLFGATLRWSKRLIYLTAAANTFKFSGCHLINGGASDRIRVDPILLESERIGNISMADCYLDNGQIISRAKRFSAIGCQQIELTDRSDVATKFTFYPYEDGGYPEVNIDNLHMFNIVAGDLITFADEPGYAWGMPTAEMETLINGAKEHLNVSMPQIRARLPRAAAVAGDASDTLVTTAASGVGAVQKLVDRDTTSEATAPYVRSKGDDAVIGASTGEVFLEDKHGQTKADTTPIILLGMGASNMRGHEEAVGGDRVIQENIYFWDSTTTGQTTTGTYVTGSEFNEAAFGTAPLDILDTGGVNYANSLLLQTANALRKAHPTRPVYVIMLARGSHGPTNYLTDATLAANSWTRDGGTEDMTLHYSNIATAIAAVPGDKTVADICVWYGTAGASAGYDDWQAQFNLIWDQAETDGLLSTEQTRIVPCVTAAARSTWFTVKQALARTETLRTNMKHADFMGADYPDDIHMGGPSLTEAGRIVAEAGLGAGNKVSRALVLTSSEHGAAEAMLTLDCWNGDNGFLRMISDEGYLEVNLNANTGTMRVTRYDAVGDTTTDLFRVEEDGPVIAENGYQTGDWQETGRGADLTISSGAATPTGRVHRIDTESSAATDDLETLTATNAYDGSIVTIQPNNSARTIVAKHNTGNIQLDGEADFSMDNNSDTLTLMYDENKAIWLEIGRSKNGS
jgi:hypothetical protein